MECPPFKTVDYDKPCPKCGGLVKKDIMLISGNEWISCSEKGCHWFGGCIKLGMYDKKEKDNGEN